MKMFNDIYTELDKLVETHQVYNIETIRDAYIVSISFVVAVFAYYDVRMFCVLTVHFYFIHSSSQHGCGRCTR